jgi:transcriptional regulator with XRE-family HTH domain
MDQDQAKSLGQLLRRRRQELGLSQRKLAAVAHMSDSSIARLEYGRFSAPRPAKLSLLATALKLSRADIFVQAGYFVPEELPSFAAYLKAKYPTIPKSGITELLNHLKKLEVRHGLHLDLTKSGTERPNDDQVGEVA